MPGGETLEQVAARADRVIERALAADGDTLLFAHSHLLRDARRRAGSASGPTAAASSCSAPPRSATLGFERERRVLKRWNWT